MGNQIFKEFSNEPMDEVDFATYEKLNILVDRLKVKIKRNWSKFINLVKKNKKINMSNLWKQTKKKVGVN